MQVELIVNVEVESLEEAEEIKYDLHNIINKCGITNSVFIGEYDKEGDNN